MKNWLVLAGVGGLWAFVGCGGDDRPPIADPADSTGGKLGAIPKGGSGNLPDAGAGGMGGSASQGLSVAITSPTAASDPVEDEVLVEDEVAVTCTVTADDPAKAVDPSSVVLAVLDAQGEPASGEDEMPLQANGSPSGEPNEYTATFRLQSVTNGRVSFRCSASGFDEDIAGSAVLDTFIDHGPTITEKLPERDSAHPLDGVLAVEFTVAAAPLSDSDTEADVTSVVLHVAGVEIEASEDSSNPGTYRASVDFQDATLFEEPPTEHTSVRIEAENSRTAKKALGLLEYPFIVDGVGPAITFKKPGANSAVNGETVVEFTVTDSGAGLDTDSLEVTVTGLPAPVHYDVDDTGVWSRKGNDFSFRFDSGVLEDIESQITVSVRATDAAGNLTDGVTLLLYLDDKPPLIDLDPGNARGVDSAKFCSASFDPLGEALGDLAKIDERSNLVRALIYDETNHGSGQTVFYMSGANRASARVYIQPDPSQAFLVDTNDDGVCDSLAREDFKYISLNPVPKAGTLTYSITDSDVPPAIFSCMIKPAAANPPDKLCSKTSDLSVVVQHDVDTKADEPVVYAIGSLTGFECTGSQWDLGPFVDTDGWVCLAARASDNLGNVGISRPLRICFDDPGVPGAPDCMQGGAIPPSCTSGCTAPPPVTAHRYRF